MDTLNMHLVSTIFYHIILDLTIYRFPTAKTHEGCDLHRAS
jgi:hypothetical protein